MVELTVTVDEDELGDYGLEASEVADELIAALAAEARRKDGAAVTFDYDWADDVEWDEVAEAVDRVASTVPSVTFTSTSNPNLNGRGMGGSRPKESERIETMDGKSRYRIRCAGCGGEGEVTVSHGWNGHFECDECGTVNRQGA